MPALLIWLIRIVGMAYITRRAMESARRTRGGTRIRRPAGSLDLPDLSIEARAVTREVRDTLRSMFWSLAAREILVLVVAGVVVATVAAVILSSAR